MVGSKEPNIGAPTRTDGVELDRIIGPARLGQPENVMIRPSPRVSTVGYQRPCAMFCAS